MVGVSAAYGQVAFHVGNYVWGDRHISREEVFLRVSAHGVPRFMREGIYWSEANVDHEGGEFARMPCEDNPDLASFFRTYYLDDLTDDPQWTAQLTVHSYDLHSLSGLRLRGLRLEDILLT
ncbi:hypothetical protein N0V84_002115 [Fusarium piperis]|uniref:Uncharacterized protein n=1 Tax=Fusarium piperis TaxID=1435070 RepID=A0A9W8WJS3_9HYPO|nr:hypothetical protein N0V84_002115 [Fusarium piperis]